MRLTGCALLLAVASLGADIRIHDAVDAFLEFYRSANAAPPAERIARFRQTVYAANPEFYRYRFEDWKAGGREPDDELLRQLKLFETYESGFPALHKKVRQQLDSSTASFAARFPDFRVDFPVYLVHSLGLADGTRRSIGGRHVFIIGLDLIARYHPGNNTPFFHHELLHFYHAQHYRQTDALYSHLWGEGLAVYVSEALNPGATALDLMLSDGRNSFAAQIDPVLPRIAAALLKDLETEDWQTHLKYFASSARDPALPARSGYYVGYLVAKRLGASYPLDRLVRLQNDVLLPAIRAELMAMTRRAPPESGPDR